MVLLEELKTHDRQSKPYSSWGNDAALHMRTWKAQSKTNTKNNSMIYILVSTFSAQQYNVIFNLKLFRLF